MRRDPERPLTTTQALILILRRRGLTIQEVTAMLRWRDPSRIQQLESKAMRELPQDHALGLARQILYQRIKRIAV
jgi:transcriptional regulator